MSPDSTDCDDVEALGSRVVCAVEGGSYGESPCDSEFDTHGTSLALFSHTLIYIYKIPIFLCHFPPHPHFQKTIFIPFTPSILIYFFTMISLRMNANNNK